MSTIATIQVIGDKADGPQLGHVVHQRYGFTHLRLEAAPALFGSKSSLTISTHHPADMAEWLESAAAAVRALIAEGVAQ
jgi:hypothetical protein